MVDVSMHNLTITRTLDAPVEKVWQAWTDSEKLKDWWGPKGVTNPTCEWDARPGGKINVVMLAGKELGPMAGQEWPMAGEFKEVVPNERLVYTASPIMNGKPIMDVNQTVTFKDLGGGRTLLSLHVEVLSTTPEAEGPLAGMEMGWNQSLDKLIEYVK